MLALKQVPKELRFDAHEYANEVCFLMDLQEFLPINCKGLFRENMYQLYINAARGSEYITKDQFLSVLNHTKKLRKRFYDFIQLTPENNLQYREQIKDFVEKSPFKITSKLHKINYAKDSFTKIMQSYLYILEIRLALEDIFMDNDIF